MAPTQLNPRQALNKAYLKVKPNRADMEGFKTALTTLFERVDPAESEEFHKNLLSDLLKHTGFAPDHFINTKGRNDLVIHNGSDAKSPVGVILEVKSPANAAEMPTRDKLNTKALQELLLYYLRERITLHNLELRHLVVTNVHEGFIFDARVFERCFARDKNLVRLFREFKEKRLAGTKTDHFYREVAEPHIDACLDELTHTHLDLRAAAKAIGTKGGDAKLVPVRKLLSAEHLLKLPFANDSNSLDRRFYSELLHIIGLAERKQGGKKLIERQPEGERDPGSLLENAIRQLKARDNLAHIPNPKQYGDSREERLFNVALELVITWTNRVLFLKLLEAQLLSYHKGDPARAFLNYKKIGSYDDLDALFFQVLARTPDERDPEIADRFQTVPYLNSSLFEPSDIEHHGLFVSQLKDRPLALHPGTVLRDSRGKRIEGERDALEYLFTFLDAYDFTSEGTGEIQEDNKTLINASVLGLIFEKINGYRDGSFFTPGFITMYMCRETIRLAVLRKFNQAKGWNCQHLNDLADRIEDREEANRVINSLKLCDPAVGSGHFLVSALNEIIALKSELDLLCDRQGRRLKNYHVEVVHDELFITDEDGDFVDYKPGLPESQRVQEAIFHEKQTLIENCLFGVDLNPNSVKICRLRLWIELLKHAYYKSENQLETLPNIDINIKCGNSLISRFDLDSDLKTALRKSKWTIDGYRLAVMSYRNAESKEHKRKMQQLINDIKGDFEAEIHNNDPRVRRKNKLTGQLNELTLQTRLFEQTPKEKAAWNKEVKKLTADIRKLEQEIETIRGNRIFENAFEWRFEFPEVLDNEGNFIGFDAVIGNPPYGISLDVNATQYANNNYELPVKSADSYALFIEKGVQLLKPLGVLSMIVPTGWYSGTSMAPLRKYFSKYTDPESFANLPYDVFDEAWVDTTIFITSKRAEETSLPRKDSHKVKIFNFPKRFKINNLNDFEEVAFESDFGLWFKSNDSFEFLTSARTEEVELLHKISVLSKPLCFYADIQRGVTPFKLTEKAEHRNSQLAFTGTIRRYSLEEGNTKYIRYDESLAEYKPSKYFKEARILLRELISRQFELQFMKVDKSFITNKSMQSILINKDCVDIHYFLGILNSKLISWYFLHKSNIA